jgi:dTMP kinase
MFITLEGIEGSGKTTQIKYLVDYLHTRGDRCVTTREPGGTTIGEKIRSILLDPASKNMATMAELLLYMADRAQHIASVVAPALSEGKIVICDRYFDATVVYQGFARGMDVALINRLHKLLFDNLKPDLTFLLDLPPRAGLKRAWREINNGQRSGQEIRFEAETLAFHESVRAGYLELADLEPHRFRVIDASLDEHQVRDRIKEAVTAFFK